MRNRSAFSPWLWSLLAAGLVALLPHGPALAQKKPPEPGRVEKPATPELKVFRLRNASANEVVSKVSRIFTPAGPGGVAVRLSADERTNSLIAFGTPADLARIIDLLREIDVPGDAEAPKPEIRFVPLGNLTPDQSVAEALRLVFPTPQAGKFLLDPRRRVAILMGGRETLARAEMLLKGLDIVSEPGSFQPRLRLQVRVYWLVNGLARKDAPEPPDRLKDVLADLAKRGFDRPRLAAQVEAAVTPGAHFELSGQAALDAPCLLTISGTPALEKEAVALDLTVNATRSPGKSAGPVCSLRSQVELAPRTAVLVGVVPADGYASAFVVEVSGQLVAEGKPRAKAKPKAPAK
jgi:hypothetical protein